MRHIYIALGSNIEPRKQYLLEAISLLDAHEAIMITQKSAIYQTAPVGYTEQADFLNMVVELNTSLSPMELLDVCQSIERKLGRKREIRFGPRTIDLDILLYHDENKKTDRLIIPHPRMHERAFVLIPLAEIAPDLFIPGWDKSVVAMVRDLSVKDKKDVTRWTVNDLEEE
ncbi:2-amino-4-hydroxy-6-hydroxymethyldihydropteridine diphosphokinase [Virgibacillus dakarensis]|nr:2-amino-4-hydroxy-6-hydroxymethyldihydropteridine diphosphokinase [Virgibacillus dakarensis]